MRAILLKSDKLPEAFFCCCFLFLFIKALEKNQQWLLYDQQREAYVRGLLGRIFELEQKSEMLSQQECKEFNSEGIDFIFSPQRPEP